MFKEGSNIRIITEYTEESIANMNKFTNITKTFNPFLTCLLGSGEVLDEKIKGKNLLTHAL